MRYTEAELEAALSVSLTALARHYGYTPFRVGKCYSLKEMDSIRIYNDRTWYRFSESTGGNQIHFMIHFCDCRDKPEAIRAINALGFGTAPPPLGTVSPKPKEIRTGIMDFVLPKRNRDCRRAYAYLASRGLSREVIRYFTCKVGLLYEDEEHHNLVFLSKDANGKIRHAFKRGTQDAYGYKFKGDVPGSDKRYGVNLANKSSNRLLVFEAVIDLMSYMDMTGDYVSNKLALGMVSDGPLEQFLKEHEYIEEIVFCLDNDKWGIAAIYGKPDIHNPGVWQEGLLSKYKEKYKTKTIVPAGGKDWNEKLMQLRSEERPFDLDKDVEQTPFPAELQFFKTTWNTCRKYEK